MTNRMMSLSAAFALIAAPATGTAVLAAQEPTRLAFGYQCDNKFALRNEGTRPVEVEYGVVGASEKGKVHLDPNQGVSLEPASAGDFEIRVDGKTVATAKNGHTACQPEAVQSQTVIVRPLNDREYVTVVEPYDPYYYGGYPVYYGPPVRYVAPRVGVYLGIGGGWYGGRGLGGRGFGGRVYGGGHRRRGR
jgi:hypothetical protein